VFSKAAQSLGNIICDRRLLCNDERFSHSVCPNLEYSCGNRCVCKHRHFIELLKTSFLATSIVVRPMISGLLQNPQVTRFKVTVLIFTRLQFGKFFGCLKNQKPANLAGFLELGTELLVIKAGF
jgi:hypothetical protein